ncbi:MAG: hypothetical protein GKR88_17720 [Flavobacteriaceae bacterium]|nr:MAG: hypothetical protein GKR88_17720 [Flavobacteriaceae bacterium]
MALVLEAYYGNDKITASKIKYKGINMQVTGLAIVGIIGGFIASWTAIGVGELIALYLLFIYRTSIETAIATGVLPS